MTIMFEQTGIYIYMYIYTSFTWKLDKIESKKKPFHILYTLNEEF